MLAAALPLRSGHLKRGFLKKAASCLHLFRAYRGRELMVHDEEEALGEGRRGFARACACVVMQ